MMIHKVMNSIFEVMETMFYFTVEERNVPESDLSVLFDGQDVRACKVTFSGEHSGAIFLLIPKNVLVSMTENFMGEDGANLSDELTDGTLKETLNMVAGNALTKVNEQSYMGLGIPEMVAPSLLPMNKDCVVFDTGKGLMAACIELEN
ncbi:MAG: chemotaxis protein CheX [Desulfobacterales bacterium]|nr:chemotaxis protein CheX [Desulfobacterales bacterium]